MITVSELAKRTPKELKGLDMDAIMYNKEYNYLLVPSISLIKPIKICVYNTKLY